MPKYARKERLIPLFSAFGDVRIFRRMESSRQQRRAEANRKSDGDKHNPPIIRIHIAVHPNAKTNFGKTGEGQGNGGCLFR
jgi:hypothetical protein